MSATRDSLRPGWEIFDVMSEAELEEFLEPVRAPRRLADERQRRRERRGPDMRPATTDAPNAPRTLRVA